MCVLLQGEELVTHKNARQLPDLSQLPEENTFKLLKSATWAEVMQRVSTISGVAAPDQLYWQWHLRCDGSYRPHTAIDLRVRVYDCTSPLVCSFAWAYQLHGRGPRCHWT